eukprot:TRINITY_DN4079_c0_g1_i2.p1 TRINITY_DN4079_c0_g1~~TRINITY_DN4079_c0_g1_i2.p1  ORF type:complete len:191 (-),score=22.26 TRINITY_DN4079_c0_g1_i2:109-681(-)
MTVSTRLRRTLSKANVFQRIPSLISKKKKATVLVVGDDSVGKLDMVSMLLGEKYESLVKDLNPLCRTLLHGKVELEVLSSTNQISPFTREVQFCGGLILLYSSESKKSFEYIEEFLKTNSTNRRRTIIVGLVPSFYTLSTSIGVLSYQGEELADKYNCTFIEAERDSQEIKGVFSRLTELILDQRLDTSR